MNFANFLKKFTNSLAKWKPIDDPLFIPDHLDQLHYNVKIFTSLINHQIMTFDLRTRKIQAIIHTILQFILLLALFSLLTQGKSKSIFPLWAALLALFGTEISHRKPLPKDRLPILRNDETQFLLQLPHSNLQFFQYIEECRHSDRKFTYELEEFLIPHFLRKKQCLQKKAAFGSADYPLQFLPHIL